MGERRPACYATCAVLLRFCCGDVAAHAWKVACHRAVLAWYGVCGRAQKARRIREYSDLSNWHLTKYPRIGKNCGQLLPVARAMSAAPLRTRCRSRARKRRV